MHNLIYNLFGDGDQLNSLQMGARAFIMFFVTLIFIRIGGLRAFGQQSAFDNVIVIMLGAILSRAVVGASPFFSVIIAGLVLVLVHRILARLSLYSTTISHLVKSDSSSLFKDGIFNEKNMRKCEVSRGDLLTGLRHNANVDSFDAVREIFMERNGHISIVKKSI